MTGTPLTVLTVFAWQTNRHTYGYANRQTIVFHIKFLGVPQGWSSRVFVVSCTLPCTLSILHQNASTQAQSNNQAKNHQKQRLSNHQQLAQIIWAGVVFCVFVFRSVFRISCVLAFLPASVSVMHCYGCVMQVRRNVIAAIASWWFEIQCNNPNKQCAQVEWSLPWSLVLWLVVVWLVVIWLVVVGLVLIWLVVLWLVVVWPVVVWLVFVWLVVVWLVVVWWSFDCCLLACLLVCLLLCCLFVCLLAIVAPLHPTMGVSSAKWHTIWKGKQSRYYYVACLSNLNLTPLKGQASLPIGFKKPTRGARERGRKPLSSHTSGAPGRCEREGVEVSWEAWEREVENTLLLTPLPGSSPPLSHTSGAPRRSEREGVNHHSLSKVWRGHLSVLAEQ